jgi:hypothetical protein
MQLQTLSCYSYVYDIIFVTLFLKSNYIASGSAPCPVKNPGYAPVLLGCGRLQGIWLIRTTEKGEEREHSLGHYEL